MCLDLIDFLLDHKEEMACICAALIKLCDKLWKRQDVEEVLLKLEAMSLGDLLAGAKLFEELYANHGKLTPTQRKRLNELSMKFVRASATSDDDDEKKES